MAGMESGEAEKMHRASPDAAANSKSGGARAQTASQDSGASIGGGGESSLVSAGAPSTVLSVPGRRLNATGPGLGFLPDTLIMAGNDTSGVINILCAACAPPPRRRREPACTKPCTEQRGDVGVVSAPMGGSRLVTAVLRAATMSQVKLLPLCAEVPASFTSGQLMEQPCRQALIVFVQWAAALSCAVRRAQPDRPAGRQ